VVKEWHTKRAIVYNGFLTRSTLGFHFHYSIFIISESNDESSNEMKTTTINGEGDFFGLVFNSETVCNGVW